MREDWPQGRTTVRFTEGELRAATALADARSTHRTNTVALGFQGIGLEAGHRFGTLAELAVAKLLCIWPEIGIDDRKDIPAHDLKLPSGLTIEVKSRRKAGGEFALNNDRLSSFRSSFGVLCWPGPDDTAVDVVGFMTGPDFQALCYTGDLGRGPRLIYPTDRLRPISQLVSIAYDRQFGVTA